MSDIENGAEAPSDTITPEERAQMRGEAADTEVAVEPEKVEADKAKPEQKTEPEKRMVDYGALAEERGRRRETEAQLRASEVEKARMEERFRAFVQQTQPPRPKPPDPEQEPFEAVKHLWAENQRINGKISAYEQHEANRQRAEVQRQHAARQWDAVTTWTKQQEQAFREKVPDYDDAVQHLLNERAAELRYLGANDLQIGETIRREAQMMAMQAAQIGKNTGEMVYEFAKRRGYQKRERAPNGQFKGQGDDLAQKLDTIEAGQSQAKTLSSVGGQAGGGEVTLKDLAGMSDDDFEAYKTKYPARYRRLMGAVG